MIEESDRRKGRPEHPLQALAGRPANMPYPLVTEIRKRKGPLAGASQPGRVINKE